MCVYVCQMQVQLSVRSSRVYVRVCVSEYQTRATNEILASSSISLGERVSPYLGSAHKEPEPLHHSSPSMKQSTTVKLAT